MGEEGHGGGGGLRAGAGGAFLKLRPDKGNLVVVVEQSAHRTIQLFAQLHIQKHAARNQLVFCINSGG